MVVRVEEIADNNIPFVFTDGHAVLEISRFYNLINDLYNIDWDIMEARYWRDTLEDPDKKRRRQAEFLIHSFLPVEFIIDIGVISRTVQHQVQAIIDQSYHLHHPQICVKPDWYY